MDKLQEKNKKILQKKLCDARGVVIRVNSCEIESDLKNFKIKKGYGYDYFVLNGNDVYVINIYGVNYPSSYWGKIIKSSMKNPNKFDKSTIRESGIVSKDRKDDAFAFQKFNGDVRYIALENGMTEDIKNVLVALGLNP